MGESKHHKTINQDKHWKVGHKGKDSNTKDGTKAMISARKMDSKSKEKNSQLRKRVRVWGKEKNGWENYQESQSKTDNHHAMTHVD